MSTQAAEAFARLGWPAAVGFDYDEAFSRNLGWLTEAEQQRLREKTVAIAGMGGVGGVYLTTLARLGVGAFRIADLDSFELANFNRQAGAFLDTLDRPKVEVMREQALGINPEAEVTVFADGVTEDNLDRFLDGVDLFLDGFDFFAPEIRARTFARCAERGIPAITAAPIGMGTAYLVFMPGGMTFEQYFRLDGLPRERQYVNMLMGLNPSGVHLPYVADAGRADIEGRRVPSTIMGCQLCAGVVGVEALRILLGRGGVQAAPWHHHFDPYRRRWISRRLRGGNAGPLQTLRRHIGYRLYGRLSRGSLPRETACEGPALTRILHAARWAPSGDNAQPWRFEQYGDEAALIRIALRSGENVYEYRDGEPTLLAAGFLLESLSLAAGRFGRALEWRGAGRCGDELLIEAAFPVRPGVAEDPLARFLEARSVDRRRYRRTPLAPDQKAALAAALGPDLSIAWHEAPADRRRIVRLNARATDIRLRAREAFEVHRRILDWDRRYSPERVPVAALGLDAMTLRIMRWAMRSWRRMDLLNRLSGTGLARLQMDVIPGTSCAAHFAVSWTACAHGADTRAERLIAAGRALQRFWLTATRLGLAVQPGLAPLCFAHYGRNDLPFTADPALRRKARGLAALVDGLAGPGEEIVFLGRIGRPMLAAPAARSIRRPLSDLLAAADERPAEAVRTGRS